MNTYIRISVNGCVCPHLQAEISDWMCLSPFTIDYYDWMYVSPIINVVNKCVCSCS